MGHNRRKACKAMGKGLEGQKARTGQAAREGGRGGGGAKGVEAEVGHRPPSPTRPSSYLLPCNGTRPRTLGAAGAAGCCQGPKHTSPASCSAQVSLGTQGNSGSRHLDRWQRSLQRAGPEDTWGRLWLVRCQSPQAFPGGRQISMKWMPSRTCSVGPKAGTHSSSSPRIAAL